ncbi:MAG TPA: branched chain amino acid aminotransferase [Flavobacteriales bacterium]|nr:branched chain amino acid aminotransferase [Flavobacteriales bacterium]
MLTTEKPNISIVKSETSKLVESDPSDLIFGKDFTDHMAICEFRNGSWGPMSIVPYGDISMNPGTSTLHYGQSVFEGMKAYKDKGGRVRLFRPTENARRINISAQRLCMPEIPEEMFMTALTELIRLDAKWVPAKEGCSLYIRPFIFADEVFLGVKPSTKYKFMIICSPASNYYKGPVRVRVERQYSRAVEGGVGYAKAAGNYAAALYPSSLAAKEGYQQLIWTDSREHKYIEEAGTMNVMFVFGDVLVTPSVENETILAGITRDSVIHLAKDLGYKVEERKISVDELVEAHKAGQLNDAFGMGTAANITIIESIGVDGIDLSLPPVEQRTVSTKIAKTLSDIKYGNIKDPYGWIEEI